MISNPNSSAHWNEAWSDADGQAWRDEALAPVYERILELAPKGRTIYDIGGGCGHFAKRALDAGYQVVVVEHNLAALDACRRIKGIQVLNVDLEICAPKIPHGATVVATEVLEHLSVEALGRVLVAARNASGVCFFSVPNDRLTPAEEPEHLRSWTAKAFLDHLRALWGGGTEARVEVLGHPARLPKEQFPSDRGQPANLLGICGLPKAYTMSVCWPARDEAADMEKCLASFRGVADQLVIGIDPRTVDNTREIAEKYADLVFDLTDLRGPPGKPEEWVDERGIHFAHARNQCIDACTGDWIFMSEAHEPLWKGKDIVLNLDVMPNFENTRVVGVIRTNGLPMMRQQWVFPWIFRNDPRIRFERATHNSLAWPDEYLYVTIPDIKTLHERDHAKEKSRQGQRKIQNRKALFDDWIRRGSEYSLHYLGAEWREWDKERAIRYFKEYMAIATNGSLKYQTRLVLAKELLGLGRVREAAETLHGAEADDWSRCEHWVFLGDIAMSKEHYDSALVYYKYAATMYGAPPVSSWFVDLAYYTWLLAQRLTEVNANMGRYEDALIWAEKTVELFDEEHAPDEAKIEARGIVTRLQEAIANGRHEQAAE